MKNKSFLTIAIMMSCLSVPLTVHAQPKKKQAPKTPNAAPVAPTEAAPEPEPPPPPPPPAAAESPAAQPATPELTATAEVDASTEGMSAPKEESSHEGALYERGGLLGAGLVLGAKVGGGFSQPFGDLGSSFLVELEVGHTLPFLKRSFELYLSGAYTQPKAEKKGIEDARLPGPASYELTQQQAQIALGLRYRLHLSTDLLRPYAAVGPRLYLMRTKVSGQAGGESFGDNEETATKLGVFAALGAELNLGPGAVVGELAFTWAKLDGYVLRDTSAGALTIAVGYRLFL